MTAVFGDSSGSLGSSILGSDVVLESGEHIEADPLVAAIKSEEFVQNPNIPALPASSYPSSPSPAQTPAATPGFSAPDSNFASAQAHGQPSMPYSPPHFRGPVPGNLPTPYPVPAATGALGESDASGAAISFLIVAAGTAAGAYYGGLKGAGAGLLTSAGLRNIYRGRRDVQRQGPSPESTMAFTIGFFGLASGMWLGYKALEEAGIA